MEDVRIVALYWARDERAIQETKNKYERYLMKIAWNVLGNAEDSEESVSDTYMRAWNSMPEHRPERLSPYLGKIAREASIDIYRRRHSLKRQGTEYASSLSELDDVVSGGETPEEALDAGLLASAINAYIRALPQEKRDVFVCRYFYMDSVREIAANFGMTEPKVKNMLLRLRNGLKTHLEQEGFAL